VVKKSRFQRKSTELDLISGGVTHTYAEIKSWRRSYQQRKARREGRLNTEPMAEHKPNDSIDVAALLQRVSHHQNTPEVLQALQHLEITLHAQENFRWRQSLASLKLQKLLHRMKLNNDPQVTDIGSFILNNVEFLDSAEFARIATGIIKPGQKYPSQHLIRLQNCGQLLAIKHQNRWRYPICQLNPRTGYLFDALPALIAKAHDHQVPEAILLFWLTSPQPPSATINKAETGGAMLDKTLLLSIAPLEHLLLDNKAEFAVLADEFITARSPASD
jgi:hypothetical protein